MGCLYPGAPGCYLRKCVLALAYLSCVDASSMFPATVKLIHSKCS